MKYLLANPFRVKTEGVTEQENTVRYIIHNGFKELSRTLELSEDSDGGDLFRLQYWEFLGKLEACHSLRIITWKEYLKLLHYMTLYLQKHNIL